MGIIREQVSHLTFIDKIEMIPQPIVDLATNGIVAEEWLCRPLNQTIKDYFSINDPIALWEREAACIFKGMNQITTVPKMLNITTSSLPFFLDTGWHWNGGVEIVEWGPRDNLEINLLEKYVNSLQAKGLKVWIDDLSMEDWPLWKTINADGYKVNFDTFVESSTLFDQLDRTERPIIIERIENIEMKKEAVSKGIRFAQGFLFH